MGASSGHRTLVFRLREQYTSIQSIDSILIRNGNEYPSIRVFARTSEYSITISVSEYSEKSNVFVFVFHSILLCKTNLPNVTS